VGFVLLTATILTLLVQVAARAKGSGRPLYAAVFSVLLAWAIHAGVDWDWEMPVVSVVFFSLGAFALARRRQHSRPDNPAASSRLAGGTRPLTRAVVGAAFLLLAVAPAFVWLSQIKLDDAAYAFSAGDCVGARSSALSSISILGDRAEPYEIVSYCDLRLGMPGAALAAINEAISLDPNNWNYQYDVALMRAAAGLDPRSAARKALSMNPYDPLVQDAWQTFSSSNRGQWITEGRSIASGFTTL
jgi:hypothetical protein